MTLLILGIALWSITHFIPTLAIRFRQQVIRKIGKLAYRGLFASSVLTAVGLIITGWQVTDPRVIYVLP
ncbi:MAG: hypothetical protein JKY89_00705, partial [Immundisolibacteraceae bacterium]|nr:hypothetical protein [Immundisolibacteraceae bacterium]